MEALQLAYLRIHLGFHYHLKLFSCAVFELSLHYQRSVIEVDGRHLALRQGPFNGTVPWYRDHPDVLGPEGENCHGRAP